MGDRVWQVQKELEELQARSCGTSEVQACDLLCTFTRLVIKHLLLNVTPGCSFEYKILQAWRCR